MRFYYTNHSKHVLLNIVILLIRLINPNISKYKQIVKFFFANSLFFLRFIILFMNLLKQESLKHLPPKFTAKSFSKAYANVS